MPELPEHIKKEILDVLNIQECDMFVFALKLCIERIKFIDSKKKSTQKSKQYLNLLRKTGEDMNKYWQAFYSHLNVLREKIQWESNR